MESKTEQQEESGNLHFDYKNTELLGKYINPHARIYSRRRNNITAREQRSLAQAIKRARFMALMPYISR